jgi:EmrB/QacA subfamily drug resistance transporter
MDATPTHIAPAAHRRRWAALAVVCLSLFVVVMDGTIVNVALPSLSIELGATTRELQWIVDAYLLVFTGLLLAAGSLGDRWGRRRILAVGLAAFAATSVLAGAVDSPGALVAARALMGIGAALIFPATLAVLTNLFTDPRERAAAIGIWSAMSGMAVAGGPIVGGWLLEHFWWGSVFFVNVPLVAVALVGVAAVVPESRDRTTPPLDLVGLALSIAAITTIVLTIIEAPEWGWASPPTLVGAVAGAVLLAVFVRWELRVEHPMLPVRIFRNLRFSAASVSITSAFFALFGFIFLITQYFQLIRGYTPLEAGVRTIPVAVSIAAASVLSPKLVERIGTTKVVSAGLASMALGFLWVSTASDVTPYVEIVGQMVLLGAGLGATTAPATESIMGSLSADKAGVGSAVNDTTRELGGTLGVAVIGSVFNSIYVGTLRDGTVFAQLPDVARTATEDSVGAAGIVAARLPDALVPSYLAEVSDAFLSGLGLACLVAAAVAAAGAVFAARYLPARAAGPGADQAAVAVSAASHAAATASGGSDRDVRVAVCPHQLHRQGARGQAGAWSDGAGHAHVSGDPPNSSS